jgi:hypothetical protein
LHRCLITVKNTSRASDAVMIIWAITAKVWGIKAIMLMRVTALATVRGRISRAKSSLKRSTICTAIITSSA